MTTKSTNLFLIVSAVAITIVWFIIGSKPLLIAVYFYIATGLVIENVFKEQARQRKDLLFFAVCYPISWLILESKENLIDMHIIFGVMLFTGFVYRGKNTQGTSNSD